MLNEIEISDLDSLEVSTELIKNKRFVLIGYTNFLCKI